MGLMFLRSEVYDATIVQMGECVVDNGQLLGVGHGFGVWSKLGYNLFELKDEVVVFWQNARQYIDRAFAAHSVGV